MSKPETPELDKMLAIVDSEKNIVIQEFMDWLFDDQHFHLWRGRDEFDRPLEVHVDREQMMADFFGIDRDKIESERREVLAWIRKRQDEEATHR